MTVKANISIPNKIALFGNWKLPILNCINDVYNIVPKNNVEVRTKEELWDLTLFLSSGVTLYLPTIIALLSLFYSCSFFNWRQLKLRCIHRLGLVKSPRWCLRRIPTHRNSLLWISTNRRFIKYTSLICWILILSWKVMKLTLAWILMIISLYIFRILILWTVKLLAFKIIVCIISNS